MYISTELWMRFAVVAMSALHGDDLHIILNEDLENAVYMQQLERVKTLLEYRADPNYRNPRGIGLSQLMIAVFHHNAELVTLLLKHGARVNEQSGVEGNFVTALHLACVSVHKESPRIAEILLAHGADVNVGIGEQLLPLSVTHRTDTMRLLLRSGADVNACNRRHESALYNVISIRNLHHVRMLLDAKADINLCNVDQDSPLHVAVHRGYEDIVQLLLERGADVDHVNNDGDSALHCAVRNGHSAIQRLLRVSGASPEIRNNDGLMPFEVESNEEPELPFLFVGDDDDGEIIDEDEG